DGLLLFDLMEKEVWNKASKDSLGIEKYYDEHKSEYQWKDRVEVVMASSADESQRNPKAPPSVAGKPTM
ncbi:MAG: hypothetical protein CML60_01515, partial [Rhodobacteraceae bacterium]|nr:hypothetical protein [Paracoccaceae bacterium]